MLTHDQVRLLDRLPRGSDWYIGTIEQTNLLGQTRPECGPVTWRRCSEEEFCDDSRASQPPLEPRRVESTATMPKLADGARCERVERASIAQIGGGGATVAQMGGVPSSEMSGGGAAMMVRNGSGGLSGGVGDGLTSRSSFAEWMAQARQQGLWQPTSPLCASQARSELVCYGARSSVIQFAQGGAYAFTGGALRWLVTSNCVDRVGRTPCFARYCYHRNEDAAMGICMRALGVPLWQCPCFHPNAPCDVTVPGDCDGRLCERPITVHNLRRARSHDQWWERLTELERPRPVDVA